MNQYKIDFFIFTYFVSLTYLDLFLVCLLEKKIPNSILEIRKLFIVYYYSSDAVREFKGTYIRMYRSNV